MSWYHLSLGLQQFGEFPWPSDIEGKSTGLELRVMGGNISRETVKNKSYLFYISDLYMLALQRWWWWWERERERARTCACEMGKKNSNVSEWTGHFVECNQTLEHSEIRSSHNFWLPCFMLMWLSSVVGFCWDSHFTPA